jgi:hypothetical protein
MGARDAVLLTPPKSSRLTRLLFYKQNASVSPLFATLTGHSQLAENAATLSPFFATPTASAPVSPVFATLTKTAGCHFVSSHSGTRHSPLLTRHFSFKEVCQSSRCFHRSPPKRKIPPFCFQYVAHSFAIRGEGGGDRHPRRPRAVERAPNMGGGYSLPGAGPATTLERKHIDP